ncbi:MAG: hypothetical protein WCR21_12370 [Bacteroidota bacterium]
MPGLKTAFELYRNDKGKYPFQGDAFDGDDVSYSAITTGLFNGSGLNNELVLNKYISFIPNLSSCLTSCWPPPYPGPTPEDYGYNIYTQATPESSKFKCGGKYFNDYQFYACNNQITANYQYQDGYSNCYCFGS